MSQWGSWSSDPRQHAQMCILESQIEFKTNTIHKLETENRLLKEEIERLQQLVKTLTKTDINTDIMDRFK